MKLLKSVSIGFRVEKKPPPFPPASRKFAPILEIDATIFEIAAVNEDSHDLRRAADILLYGIQKHLGRNLPFGCHFFHLRRCDSCGFRQPLIYRDPSVCQLVQVIRI